MSVDGEDVLPEDRGYYQHVEYCWTYGDQKDIKGRFSNLADNKPPLDRTIAIATTGMNLNITGWIGTVRRPSFLKAEDGDNLNRLAIFMRGKVARRTFLATSD